MIDTQRRKRVMQRSMALGHCICDPKKPCPCDIFKQKNICLCAGERLDNPTGPVALTQLVEKAGCASKIDQAFLKEVLGGLTFPENPHVLVGVPAGDDAGVYELEDGTCLVQTVDVFTPAVDDPYLFGQIAAANSVSDIYAMGGTPLTALSVLGFPVRMIPDQAMADILRGGIDKMNEAGVALIGGHSINDPQVKAGFAVTGVIDKDKVKTNARARVADVLILTKPLGTGIIAFANQIGRASPESVFAAAKSMTTLNKTAAELMVQFGASACTDVTGFSLLGHLAEMVRRSGLDAELVWDDIPLLPGVLDYVAQGIFPGAIERNKESCGKAVLSGPGVTEEMADLLYDAQTSGGLLIAIAADSAPALLDALHQHQLPAAVIGRMVAGKGMIHIKTTGQRTMPARQTKPAPQKQLQPQEACCCSTSLTQSAPASNGPEDLYKQFLLAVGKPGGLDAYTKQAINIALSVLSKCEPCLKIHVEKARKMGFSQPEIDEAAWMGIAFGGSPVMMFYKSLSEK
ncbi:MAG: selenide, water dikinase SelD [Anaerohalosphaeraceae bacterium]